MPKKGSEPQRSVLEELDAAARDFYTPRRMDEGEGARKRAQRDWKRANRRLTDAIIAAKGVEDSVPGNTPEAQIAILDAAKAIGMANPNAVSFARGHRLRPH